MEANVLPFALINLLGSLTYVVVVVALHILPTGYDPRHNAVSDNLCTQMRLKSDDHHGDILSIAQRAIMSTHSEFGARRDRTFVLARLRTILAGRKDTPNNWADIACRVQSRYCR